MSRPRITIGATVLASAVRIQAGIEPHIRTVIVGDNRLRIVPQKLGLNLRLSGFGRAPVDGLVVESLKSIAGVQRSAPATNRCWFPWHTSPEVAIPSPEPAENL